MLEYIGDTKIQMSRQWDTEYDRSSQKPEFHVFLVESEPKTARSRRTIMLPDFVITILCDTLPTKRCYRAVG